MNLRPPAFARLLSARRSVLVSSTAFSNLTASSLFGSSQMAALKTASGLTYPIAKEGDVVDTIHGREWSKS